MASCRSFDDVLPAELLRAVESAAHRENKEYDSFWYVLPRDGLTFAPARNAIEQTLEFICKTVALQMVRKTGAKGIEWWVHKRPSGAHMPMHFDKDEGLFARKQQLKHPQVSSVLYLTDAGGATLVVQQTCASQDITQMFPRKPRAGVSCAPKRNRYFHFPGNLLHGVLPAEPIVQKVGDRVEIDREAEHLPRITLLLNLWSRRPEDETCRDISDQEAVSARFGTCLDKIRWKQVMALATTWRTPTKLNEGLKEIGSSIENMFWYDPSGRREQQLERRRRYENRLARRETCSATAKLTSFPAPD
eukprot:g79967.t1